MDKMTDRQRYSHTKKQPKRQTDEDIARQRNKLKERQTDRQTDRQTQKDIQTPRKTVALEN